MNFLQVTMLHNSRRVYEAYHIAREKLLTSHRSQKEIMTSVFMENHSRKVNSSGYIHLFFEGKSKIIHHPWTGPFKIVKQISEYDYKIRNVQRKKKLQVVSLW